MYFFFYFVVALVFVTILLFLFVGLSYSKDLKDNSIASYECGFDSIKEARMNFSYRFFLISILFLIFDVEIALVLPIPYLVMSEDLFLEVMVFFFVLLVGLLYEYFNGMLMWM